jgi:hypothetical protein
MELKLAVLADAANVSQEGKLNITGIFDSIGFEEPPFTWPLINFVCRFEVHPAETGHHPVLVRVADEDGAELVRIEGELRIRRKPNAPPGEPVRTQFIVPIHNATFPKPGRYVFDILVDGRYEGSVSLTVVLNQ